MPNTAKLVAAAVSYATSWKILLKCSSISLSCCSGCESFLPIDHPNNCSNTWAARVSSRTEALVFNGCCHDASTHCLMSGEVRRRLTGVDKPGHKNLHWFGSLALVEVVGAVVAEHGLLQCHQEREVLADRTRFSTST